MLKLSLERGNEEDLPAHEAWLQKQRHDCRNRGMGNNMAPWSLSGNSRCSALLGNRAIPCCLQSAFHQISVVLPGCNVSHTHSHVHTYKYACTSTLSGFDLKYTLCASPGPWSLFWRLRHIQICARTSQRNRLGSWSREMLGNYLNK